MSEFNGPGVSLSNLWSRLYELTRNHKRSNYPLTISNTQQV